MSTQLSAFSKSTLSVNIFLLCFIATKVCVRECAAEYFSSVSSLQKLNEAEIKLAEALEQHIEEKQQNLENIRSFLHYVESKHKLIQADPEDYLGNPLNAFSLMKRMVIDWKNFVEKVIKMDSHNVFIKVLKQLQSENALPVETDLRGAVRGLARLQKVYNLKASDLAKGVFNGIDYGSNLTSQNCYEIATALLDEQEPLLALGWFKVALKQLSGEQNHSTKRKFDQELMKYRKGIHKMAPYYNADGRWLVLMSEIGKAFEKSNQWDVYPTFSNYSRLCNGIQLPEKVHHKLKCTLDTRNNPLFFLAPLKKEELYIDPELTIYHNFLNDADVESILSMSDKNIHHSVTGDEFEQLDQTVWLNSNMSSISKIYTLLGHVTELNMSSAQNMQVVNYGIGGQYGPHPDFLGETYSATFGGERLSTNMLYLSNVEQGGFSVFPKVNVYVRPERGSLVTWYNLHRSLSGDYRTMHASCPIIRGSKSVAVTWILTQFQEFRRPCELVNDDFKSKHYFSWDLH